jgi:hypothetical protein
VVAVAAAGEVSSFFSFLEMNSGVGEAQGGVGGRMVALTIPM